MATYSEVKAGLDNIAEFIRAQRGSMESVKATATTVASNLNGLATEYADVVAAITAYPAETTDAAELAAKAELAKLIVEFTALLAHATAVSTIDLDT